MKTLFALAALTLAATAVPAHAFDTSIREMTARLKAGKPVPIADVAELMRKSERWCYWEEASTCSWSDIYLEVTDAGASYEIGNAWDATRDIVFTDTGVFEGNAICETGVDWLPFVRGIWRETGLPINGRELQALKDEVAASRSEAVIDCFDYSYLSVDASALTITLLQKQYTDGAYMPQFDTEVTIHFDPARAAALTWRW